MANSYYLVSTIDTDYYHYYSGIGALGDNEKKGIAEKVNMGVLYSIIKNNMELIEVSRQSLAELLPGMALGLSGAEQNEHSDLIANLITKLQQDRDYQLSLAEYEGLKRIPPEDYCFMLSEVLLRIVGSEEMDYQSVIVVLDQIVTQLGSGSDDLVKSANEMKGFIANLESMPEGSKVPVTQFFPTMLNFILQLSALTSKITNDQINDAIWYQIWKCQSFILGMFIDGFPQKTDQSEQLSKWDLLMLQSLNGFRSYLEPFQIADLDDLLKQYQDCFHNTNKVELTKVETE